MRRRSGTDAEDGDGAGVLTVFIDSMVVASSAQ